MVAVWIYLKQLFFSLSLSLFLFTLWFVGSLWGEATGDPVWLHNCTEISLFMVARRDLRQILRFSASFVHAHKHIPRNTPSL